MHHYSRHVVDLDKIGVRFLDDGRVVIDLDLSTTVIFGEHDHLVAAHEVADTLEALSLAIRRQSARRVA